MEQSLHSSRLADIGFKLLVWLGYLNETSNLGTQKRIPLKDVLSLVQTDAVRGSI